MTTQNTFEFKAWKHHMVKFPETITTNQIDYLARLVSQYKIKVEVSTLAKLVEKSVAGQTTEGKLFSAYLSMIESAIKTKKVVKRDNPVDSRICLEYVRSKLNEARHTVA